MVRVGYARVWFVFGMYIFCPLNLNLLQEYSIAFMGELIGNCVCFFGL